MKSRTIACTLIVLLTLCPGSFGQAPTAADLAALRAQIDALKADYDRRIQALETQFQALQGQAQPAQPPQVPPTQAPAPAGGQQPPAVEVPPGAQGAGGPGGSLPVYGGATAGSKVFNPDIAVIGDFLGAAGSNKLNPDTALEMHESEAAFQAIVDPYARADFFFSFGEQAIWINDGLERGFRF